MTSVARHVRGLELKVILLLLLVTVKGEGESNADAAPQETPEQFLFSYGVNDDKTGNSFAHQQATGAQGTQGEYRVALPDGRTQVVSYTADENGYNAVVTYEGVAVHPEDQFPTGEVESRRPVPSSPHPSRQRPVITSLPIRHPPTNHPHDDLLLIHPTTPAPHFLAHNPIFPVTDLAIDVPIFQDQAHLQNLEHSPPHHPPGPNFSPHRTPKLRRSKPVVPKPTLIPTHGPPQSGFDFPLGTSPRNPLFTGLHEQQFFDGPLHFPQGNSHSNPAFQQLQDIHGPSLQAFPNTVFPEGNDLQNVFIDIPKINPKQSNGFELDQTTDLSLFIPEEDLHNGNFPGIVSTSLPLHQVPIDSQGGFLIDGGHPFSFSGTPSPHHLGHIPDQITTIRHHGTPVHNPVQSPFHPVSPVPHHSTSFSHHVNAPLIHSPQPHHGLSVTHQEIPIHHPTIPVPHHGAPVSNQDFDILHHGSPVPIHDHDNQLTVVSGHGNPASSHDHGITPTTFHPPFLGKQLSQRTTPDPHFGSPAPPPQHGGTFIKHGIPAPIFTSPASHHENVFLHQGTPVPHFTSATPHQGGSFVQHGIPLPAPHHENSVSHHGSHAPLVSSPIPLHETSFSHHGNPLPLISSPAPHHHSSISHHGNPFPLISSPVPHHESSLHGSPGPLISSPAPHHENSFSHHGSPGPLITSAAPLHESSFSHHGSRGPLITSAAPLHENSFSHHGSRGPLITSAAPLHENSFSHHGSPGPLITSAAPLHESSFSQHGSPVQHHESSHHGSPVPLISSPAPHHGTSFSHFVSPAPLISSPAPHHGSSSSHLVSHHGSPVPLISSPAPLHESSISHQQRPITQISSPFPIHDEFVSHHRSPTPIISSPAPHHQISHHRNPAPLISSPAPHHDISHHRSPAPLLSSPAPHHDISHHRSPAPLLSSPAPHHEISHHRSPAPLLSSPAPHHDIPGSHFRNSFPFISSPVPHHGIGQGTPIPHITSPVPHHRSPVPHHTEGIPHSPTPSTPPFLSSTFRPTGPEAFIPSPLEHQATVRPLTFSRPRGTVFPSSGKRGNRRQNNLPKTLSPFFPGGQTLDREQVLRHKGVSRSSRSFLRKRNVKTNS